MNDREKEKKETKKEETKGAQNELCLKTFFATFWGLKPHSELRAHPIRTSYDSTPIVPASAKIHTPSISTHQRSLSLLDGHFTALKLRKIEGERQQS